MGGIGENVTVEGLVSRMPRAKCVLIGKYFGCDCCGTMMFRYCPCCPACGAMMIDTRKIEESDGES